MPGGQCACTQPSALSPAWVSACDSLLSRPLCTSPARLPAPLCCLLRDPEVHSPSLSPISSLSEPAEHPKAKQQEKYPKYVCEQQAF